MPTLTTFYLNGPTLDTSTGVFLDAELTQCAPDGYYSDGVTVREQVGCELLPSDLCPFCGVDCDISFSYVPESPGVYYIPVELDASIGPVIINIDLPNAPSGVSVLYDSVVYNELVSPTFGYLAAPSGLETYVGDVANDCGIVSGAPYTLDKYSLDSTITFNPTGSTELVNVLPSQMQTTLGSPGMCTIVVPKTAVAPTLMVLKIVSICEHTDFSISLPCPSSRLPISYTSSEMVNSSLLVCFQVESSNFYVIPINGDGITLGLYDMVYSDVTCTAPLSDGYYLSSVCPAPNNWYRVENGIIVEFGVCSRSFVYDATQCGDVSNVVTVVSGSSIVIGTVVSLDSNQFSDCKFVITSVSISTPTLVVDTIESSISCSDFCAYYKVYNIDTIDASVTYTDCDGISQNIIIPIHSYVFICARYDTITSSESINIIFDLCNCN
jgi:hypothetical protein